MTSTGGIKHVILLQKFIQLPDHVFLSCSCLHSLYISPVQWIDVLTFQRLLTQDTVFQSSSDTHYGPQYSTVPD